MIGAISAGIQGLMGAGQMIAGLTMPKPEIPEYEIPQELYANMTDAEYWSFQGLPDASKQQFIEQSARAGASALSSSTSRKGGLGLASSVAQQRSDDAKSMLAMDSQARMQNLQHFWNAREKVAGAKDFKYEKDLGKFMYEDQERKSMIGAGIQSMGGALGAMVDLQAEGELDDLFGGEEGRLGRQTKRADRKAVRTDKRADRNMNKMLGDLTW